MDDTAAAAKLLKLCPTLCYPIDSSPPGSPILGILQARTLEWVAISFSNAWKWKVKVKSLSPVWLLATPWTAAHQAPESMGLSRQEYWSGVPSPSPIRVGVVAFSGARWHKQRNNDSREKPDKLGEVNLWEKRKDTFLTIIRKNRKNGWKCRLSGIKWRISHLMTVFFL